MSDTLLTRLRAIWPGEPQAYGSSIELGHLASEEDGKAILALVRSLMDEPPELRCSVHRCGLAPEDTNTETCPLHDWELEGTGWSATCEIVWAVSVGLSGETR